ncbi:MAG: phage virion morphogenesis protein [Candidatus Thorarchaeota archaeon]
MIEVSVQLNETPETVDLISKIAQDQRRFGLFRSIARLLFHSWWAETFRLQGARRGHAPWKPLNPNYAAWKVAHGKPNKILQYTGHLMGSPNIIREDATSLLWGTKIPYAKYHQDPVERGRPPKREIIFITEADKQELSRFTARFIDKILRMKA